MIEMAKNNPTGLPIDIALKSKIPLTNEVLMRAPTDEADRQLIIRFLSDFILY